MSSFRGEIYNWSLDLIKEDKTLEGIFLLLSTWNFAWFKKHVTTFDLDEFKRVFSACDFDYFKDRFFERTDFSDDEIKKRIAEIYSALANLIGIRYVGATKIMHLIIPHFFVMWDTTIRNHYRFKTSANDYVSFMKEMKRKYDTKEFGELQTDVTIPRAIDLYNLEVTDSCSLCKPKRKKH